MPQKRVANVLLLVPLLFSACLPLPHRANVTPLVYGQIWREGSPASGVRLRVALGDEDDLCGGKYSEVATDVRGEFAVPPIQSYDLFLFPMAHRQFVWNLCVDAPEGWANIHESRGYTLVDTGPRWFSEVTCHTSESRLLLMQCTEKRDLNPSSEKAHKILRGSE
jgi:hypothetical protein